MTLRTLHEQGTLDAYQEFMRKPGADTVMRAAASNVADGTWDSEFLAITGHPGTRTVAQAHQLFAVVVIHHNIMLGNILRFKVRAGGTPQPDKERELNAQMLGDLPEPFAAWVDPHQALGDEDGWLQWTLPVFANCMTSDPQRGLQDTMVLTDPARVPLEIGSTKASRTLFHLRQEHAVARWPYDTDWVTVYVVDGELAKV